MFKILKTNESGVILLMVMGIIMVMGIFTLSIVSLNVGEVKKGEQQIRRLQVEQIVQGAFWIAYSNLYSGINPDGQQVPVTIDGHTYTAQITLTGTGDGPGGTDTWEIKVDY